jgi:hypothetical protein
MPNNRLKIAKEGMAKAAGSAKPIIAQKLFLKKIKFFKLFYIVKLIQSFFLSQSFIQLLIIDGINF